MFSIEGYVPLAKLWGKFELKFGNWCLARACEFYRADSFDRKHIFGSPRDLCEDLFLATLKNFDPKSVAADGEVISILPTFSGSSASFYQKATALESFGIADNPEEAGPEDEWLYRMGSSQFSATTDMDPEVATWIEEYCDCGKAKPNGLSIQKTPFHTLPYFFERPSFTVAKQLPPWTSDMIEETYARNLPPQVLGNPLCLAEDVAQKWETSLSLAALSDVLATAIPSVEFSKPPKANPKGGAPNKIDKVIAIYVQENMPEKALTAKEELRLIVSKLDVGEKVSLSTLRNAKKRVSTTD